MSREDHSPAYMVLLRTAQRVQRQRSEWIFSCRAEGQREQGSFLQLINQLSVCKDFYSKKDQTSSARIGTAPKGRKAISPPVGANVQIPLQHRTFSLQVAGQAIESLLVKRCPCHLDAHASRQHSNATLQVTVAYNVKHAALGAAPCLWSGPAPRTFRTFSRLSRVRCGRPGSDLCSVAYPRNMPCR